MPALPPRVLFYATAVVCVAIAALGVTVILNPPGGTPGELGIAAGVATAVAIALRFPLHLAPKVSHEMAAAPIIVAMLTLSPGLAVVTVAAGALAGECLKANRRTAQAAFNISLWVLGTAAGCGVAAALHGSAGSQTELLPVAGSALTLHVVTTSLTEVIVALHIGQRLFHQFWARYREPLVHEWALLAIGALGGLVVELRPWAFPLVAVPAILVYRSLRTQRERLQQTEAGLAESERQRLRLSAIIEATPDFVATADPDGRIRYLNAAGRSMLGFEATQELPEVWLHEVASGWSDGAAEASAHGTWTGEGAIRSKDGLELPVSQVVVAHQAGGTSGYLSTVARDISIHKKLEADLKRLADFDGLTGLHNRRSFDRELLARVADSASRPRPLALLLLDLDGFKRVNDSFGHETGDDLLRAVGEVLAGGHPGDVAARLGGDEFAVITTSLRNPALQRATALAAEIEARTGVIAEGVTASIGVAFFGEHGRTAAELLRAADTAMYRAKRERRGIVSADAA